MPKKLDDFLVELSSEDEKVRLNAVIALGDSDDSEALIILNRYKADQSSAVRFYTKKSMLKLKAKFQIAENDESLSTELSDDVKEKILKIKNIERIKDKTKIDKLFNDIESEDNPLIRAIIVTVLGKLCDEKHITRIIALTEHTDSRIVANAVEALEFINSEKSIEALTKLLFHEDSRVKANVCKALWKFSGTKKDIGLMVMGRLKELVSSDKPWIRSSAIYVLSEIKNDEAIKLIKECKNDPEKIIKDQASEILKKIGVTDPPPAAANINKADIEELPPDEFMPKMVFFVKKFFGTLSKSIKNFRDKVGHDNFINYFKYSIYFVIFIVIFITAFNAIWEMRTVKVVEKEKVEQVNNEIVSRNVSEAADSLKKLKFDDTIVKLERELKSNPDDMVSRKLLAVAYYQKAQVFLTSKKNKEAREFIEKSLALSSEFADSILALAKIQISMNENDAAFETLKNAAAKNLDHAGLDLEYAKMLILKNELKEAKDFIQKSIDKDSAFGEAYYVMTRCMLLLKDFDQAKAYYQKAVFLEPENNSARYEISQKFLDAGIYAEAIKELSVLIKSNSKDTAMREKLGNVYFQLSSYDAAINEFKKILEITQNNYEVNFKIGLCYQALDNIDEMHKYIYKAVKLNGNFAEGHHILGTIYDFKKNYASAKQCYDNAIKINPKLAGPYISYGKMYMNANPPQYQYAVTVFNNALKFLPDHPDVLYLLGISYLNLKENKNAKDVLTKYMGMISKDTALYKELAETVSKL